MKYYLIILFGVFSNVSAQNFELVLPEGHDNGITDFVFFENGKKGISLEASGKSFVWDIERGQLLAKLVDSNALGPIVLSPDSHYFFIGQKISFDTSSLLIFSTGQFKLLHRILLPKCSELVFRNLLFEFSTDGNALILKTGKDKRSFTLNLATGKLVQSSFNYDFKDELDFYFPVNDTFYFSPSKRIYALSLGDTISVRYNDRNVYLLKRLIEPVAKLFSADDRHIYFVYDNFISKLDVSTGEYTSSILPNIQNTRNAAISYDEKIISLLTKDQHIQLWDIETRKKLMEIAAPAGIAAMKFDREGKVLFLITQQFNPDTYPGVNTKLMVLDIFKKKILETGEGAGYYLPEVVIVIKEPENIDNSTDIAMSQFYENFEDSVDHVFFNKIPVDDSQMLQGSFNISLDGRTAFLGTAPDVESLSPEEKDKLVYLCRGLFGKQLEFIKNSSTLYRVDSFYHINRYFDADVVSNRSRYLFNNNRLFDFRKRKEVVAVYQVAGSGTILKTPDNYYMSSGIPKWMNFRKGDKLVSFEQLDVRYNRPDKVLEAIGNTDTALIKSYRKAWEKRIKKLGIDTTAFRDGYSVPECDFVNRDLIGYEQKDNTLSLYIKGTDSTFKLDRFNVWVNETPIFGQRGISIRKKNSSRFDTTLTIKLSQGENRIETSVTNVNGTESYRMPLMVNYTPAVKEKESLSFIGIGIDRFSNNKYNLKYSRKDVRDLAKKLKEKYKENISIDTLFNENVTVSNIKALKQKLQQTTVNDKVIVAYSGHGLLSKDYDYYLSTYSINFDKPEENGLAYDVLENLLDSIPARKKLMLIDACHSGEVDKEELMRIDASPDSLIKGIKPVVYKQDGKHLGMKNSFELMQSLFVNVGKSTGATIISAAAGTQFALERGDLKNGVFTYSILEAMNKYPTMKISELKKTVGERVEQLTNGLQKPTSRKETVSFEWDIW